MSYSTCSSSHWMAILLGTKVLHPKLELASQRVHECTHKPKLVNNVCSLDFSKLQQFVLSKFQSKAAHHIKLGKPLETPLQLEHGILYPLFQKPTFTTNPHRG